MLLYPRFCSCQITRIHIHKWIMLFLQITLHSFHSVAADLICLIRHCKLSVTLCYVTLRWVLHQPSVDLFSHTEFETDPEFLLVSYSSSLCFHSLSVPLSQLLSPTIIGLVIGHSLSSTGNLPVAGLSLENAERYTGSEKSKDQIC